MFLNIAWYFFIYAFLGWCVEVVYAAVISGKFVNRGFLNGPFCPIYGLGMLLVLHLLGPVKNNIFLMFFGAVIIASAVELTAGFLLEKLFHKRWWDYSELRFNLGGYISLKFSLQWGLACIIVLDRIHPPIIALVNWIPLTLSQVLLLFLAVLLLIDLISTVNSILKLSRKLETIDEISLRIKEASDSIGENLASGAIALAQKKDDLGERFEEQREIIEADLAEMRIAQQKALAHRKQALQELRQANRELLEATFFGYKRLLRAFPDLKSKDHKDALEQLKKVKQEAE